MAVCLSYIQLNIGALGREKGHNSQQESQISIDCHLLHQHMNIPVAEWNQEWSTGNGVLTSTLVWNQDMGMYRMGYLHNDQHMGMGH